MSLPRWLSGSAVRPDGGSIRISKLQDARRNKGKGGRRRIRVTWQNDRGRESIGTRRTHSRESRNLLGFGLNKEIRGGKVGRSEGHNGMGLSKSGNYLGGAYPNATSAMIRYGLKHPLPCRHWGHCERAHTALNTKTHAVPACGFPVHFCL